MASAPVSPVQHLGGGPLHLLQDLQQLGVVVTEAPPAQDPGQVVAGPQGQDAELALKRRTERRLQRGRPPPPIQHQEHHQSQ